MIDVEKLIKQNSELMALLKIIHSFQLNDCWLCAGTLRNYIWDYLSTGNTSSNINFSDIDVIFFDKNISYEQTVEIENEKQQKISMSLGYADFLLFRFAFVKKSPCI